MKLCHVCLYECSDETELCPVCGADLTDDEVQKDEVETEDIQNEEQECLIKDPVLLATMEDVVSAEIFKDILADNNIPFSSSQDESGSIRVVFGGGIVGEEIYVESKDLEKAEEIYQEFLNQEDVFFDEEFSNEEFEEE